MADPPRRGPPAPPPGEVIRYAYLRTHEAAAGAEQGRKERPCAVVPALVRAGDVVEAMIAPITSRAPCWIVLTEVTRFAWPGPDLRSVETGGGLAGSHGLLPARLFERVRDAIVARARARRLRAVTRTQ